MLARELTAGALLSDRVARSKARCERSLARFCEEAAEIAVPGSPFVLSWHVEEAALHLEAMARRELLELVVNQPPGTTKSLLACVMFPAWVWSFRPTERFICASYADDVVIGHNQRLIRVLESDWYRERWGELLAANPSAKILHNTKGGIVYTTSIPGGTCTGWHANIKIVDDPIKPADAVQNYGAIGPKIRAVSEWQRSTLSTRNVDHRAAATLLVMQRLADDDLAGELVAAGYEHLNLPMHHVRAERCRTSVGGDRRTQDGELLCPERIDEEAAARSAQKLGGEASSQLEQKPIAKTGGPFDASWLRYFDTLPAGSALHAVQVWDTNFKGPAGTDPIAGLVIRSYLNRAAKPHRKDFYVTHGEQGMLDAPDHQSAIEAIFAEHPDVLEALLEESANGPAIAQHLRRKIRRPRSVVLLPTRGGKHARMNAIKAIVKDGRVFLPRDPRHVVWVSALEMQLVRFGRMRRDDLADALSHGLLYLDDRRSAFATAMTAASERFAT